MERQGWGSRAALVAAWMVLGAAAPAQERTSTELTVVHRFQIPDGEAWGSVTIPLKAGGWRVGHPEGPVASEAQLRGVLRAVASLELGARCTGWVSGPTSYPCGFSLRAIDLAGTVQELYEASVVGESSTAAANAASETDAAEAHASSPRSPRLDAERFVGLRAPATYRGDKSDALGGTLRFEIRALSNPLVPSRFDRGSGLVILRTRIAGAPS